MDPVFAEVWVRNLPTIGERVRTIERAVSAAERGELDGDLAARALAAAHKLSGSLGSFGLARGSELARELERRFEPGQTPLDAAGLAQLAAALRAEIRA